MLFKKQLISNVDTNIITGFLGVGKTTAIINLLKQRPANEFWSILVNEFGDMGIDGHLMENDDSSVMIKQVPGGCICCAAGLPLQVAVNQLLKQTHPDRLIIEPSGMGHPRKIIKSLTEQHYKGVLDMRACLCLLDPRKLKDSRYLESELFIDQIDVADIIIANKTDLSKKKDKDNFKKFISERYNNKVTHWVNHGLLQLEWLNQTYTTLKQVNSHHIMVNNLLENNFNKMTIDFELNIQFNSGELLAFLSTLKVERLKAVLNTNNGFIVFNYADGCMSSKISENSTINRLEIISLNLISQSVIKSKLMRFV